MDNFNSWHDQRMVQSKMQEVEGAAGDGRLRREARTSHPNWLARTVGALFNVLAGGRTDTPDRRSGEHVSYRSCTGKVAK